MNKIVCCVIIFIAAFFDSPLPSSAQGTNYNQIISTSTSKITTNPNDYSSYYNRGLAYYKLKQYEPAISDFDKAISINPKDLDSYYNRAAAHCEVKNTEKAIKDYEKIIELKSNEVDAYINLATIYIENKNFDLARKHFENGRKFNPNNEKIREGLSLVKTLFEKEIKTISEIKIEKAKGAVRDDLSILTGTWDNGNDVIYIIESYLSKIEFN